MRMSPLAPCLVSALLFCFQSVPAQTSAESIDWTEARRLFQMEQRGQALTEEEAAYLPSDFVADGVHPSESGREKVARQLLEFFATNPLATDWFLR